MIYPGRGLPSPGTGEEYEISQARYFRYQNAGIFQTGKKHLQVAHSIQKGDARKWPEERPEKCFRRVPHKVQGEMYEHAPGEGDESDISGMQA